MVPRDRLHPRLEQLAAELATAQDRLGVEHERRVGGDHVGIELGVVDEHEPVAELSLESLAEAERWARATADLLLNR